MMLATAMTSSALPVPPGALPVAVPGTANPSNTALTGTVLADVTVPFANSAVPPPGLTGGHQAISMVFRQTNVLVPFYLQQRYMAEGATNGHLAGLPPPGFTGTLRTVVVQEAVSGTLDFYLQAANTSAPLVPGDPNTIFRISAGGFNTAGFAGDALDVFFRTDGNPANVIPGTTPVVVGLTGDNPPQTADRLSFNMNDPGFDFSSDLSGGDSLFGGDVSRFILIRTNARTFGPSTVTVSSTGTAYVSSLAPIPEPAGLAVVGLAGLAFARRRRRDR
jgi:MYXO-CTERM domain-containing protein